MISVFNMHISICICGIRKTKMLPWQSLHQVIVITLNSSKQNVLKNCKMVVWKKFARKLNLSTRFQALTTQDLLWSNRYRHLLLLSLNKNIEDPENEDLIQILHKIIIDSSNWFNLADRFFSDSSCSVHASTSIKIDLILRSTSSVY